MALNATLGASDANSYVTRSEADAYFADRMHSSAWTNLSGSVQDKLLITSSQMLDWYKNWKGTKNTVAQFMQWPRADATRPDGTVIDDDALPPEMKIAVYELSFVSIEGDRMEDDPLAGIGQLRAGSLMIKAGAEKPNQTNVKPIPPQIDRILSDIIEAGSGFGIVRLQRA